LFLIINVIIILLIWSKIMLKSLLCIYYN